MAKKMLVNLLLLLTVFEVLLVSICEAKPSAGRHEKRFFCSSSRPGGLEWVNSWHGDFTKYCHNGDSIKIWRSMHRNCKEDRIHFFECGAGPANEQNLNCAWNGDYVNHYDADVNYKCPNNGFITGVKSVYNDDRRDRRFKFRCCNKSGFTAHSCQTTPYKNNWDQDLYYRVPFGYFLVGVTSVHDNHYEDRRYKFEICKIDHGK